MLNRSTERARRTLTAAPAPEPPQHLAQITPELDSAPADEDLGDVELLVSMTFARQLAIDAQASLDAERQVRA